MLCVRVEDIARLKLLHMNARCALHVDPASRLKEIKVVLALVLTACMGRLGGYTVLESGIRIIGRDQQAGRKVELMW